MKHLLIEHLTVPEARQVIRQELECFFKENNLFPQKHAEEDNIVNVQGAAHILGLSVPTIYAMVNKSQLPYAKRTKRLYFYKSDLLNFIKAGRKGTASEIEIEASNYLSTKKGLNNGK